MRIGLPSAESLRGGSFKALALVSVRSRIPLTHLYGTLLILQKWSGEHVCENIDIWVSCSRYSPIFFLPFERQSPDNVQTQLYVCLKCLCWPFSCCVSLSHVLTSCCYSPSSSSVSSSCRRRSWVCLCSSCWGLLDWGRSPWRLRRTRQAHTLQRLSAVPTTP